MAVLLVLWTSIPLEPALEDDCELECQGNPSAVGLQDADTRAFAWMEFYAGKAEATRMFTCAGFRSAKLDYLYMKGRDGRANPMDLLTPAGMGCLVSSNNILSSLFLKSGNPFC